MLSLPFLFRVNSRVASLRFVTVVLASVGNFSPLQLPRVMVGQVSLPRDQLLLPGLLNFGVSQHTSTSPVSEQILAVTGSLEPSEPISTSKELMVTVSPQFLPDLRQGPVEGLGAGVGGLEGDEGLDGDGDLDGEDGLEPLLEHETELLLSRVHVFLLTVSDAATL